MNTFCKYLKIKALRINSWILAVLLCCGATFSAMAQDDDLYFSPKRQKEIDKQNAKLKAYYDSLWAAQRKVVPATDYTETWSNMDTTDNRGYRGIYDLSQQYETYQEDEEERESYADRLRYEDPTYVVYTRDPYVYDTWGGWGGYPGWGINMGWNSWGGWGWSVGWSYPYYSAWGYPYGGWGYPYSPYSPYYPYNPYCYGCYYPTPSPTNVTHRQQTGNMSGTNSGTGYTPGNRASSRPSSGSTMALPRGSNYSVTRSTNRSRSTEGVGQSSPQQQRSSNSVNYRSTQGQETNYNYNNSGSSNNSSSYQSTQRSTSSSQPSFGGGNSGGSRGSAPSSGSSGGNYRSTRGR